MNKKIEKPNYTQTPNILFDEIMRDLNGAELKVILAVIRKTFGWHKERDRISLTQLEEMTGLSRQGILNAIHGKKKEKSVIGGLVNKGYIKIIETKQGNVYELIVNEVDQQETASQLSRLEVVNKVDQESGLASQQSRHTKESTLNKLSKEIYSPKSLELANLLYSLHKQIDAGFNRTSKQLEKWASDIDKINRLDGRSFDDIEKTIRWVKNDDFWKTNIISGEKLRIQFDKVFIKSKSEQRSGYLKPLPVQTRTAFLDMED